MIQVGLIHAVNLLLIGYQKINKQFFAQTVMRQTRDDLTSLTYSRPPFLPPRPAMVTQSLEHLPSHQMPLDLGHRSRTPASHAAYPITSNLSLHSGYGPLQHTSPQVVPSLSSNYYVSFSFL